MYRSFTDRVLGGVCGGLAAVLHVSAWWLRAAFIVLTVITSGAFAALYVVLWWLLPQESLVDKKRANPGCLLLIILLVVATAAAWVLHSNNGLRAPSGQELFWPGVAVVVCAVFFLRQVRA